MRKTALPTPRLEIFPDRIQHNVESVLDLCHSRGIKVACVTKVVSAHPAVAEAYEAGGADMLADSRVANIRSLCFQGVKKPLLLLRLPAPSEAFDVVRFADYSLNSSLVTMKALSEAAGMQGLTHNVIVMMDVGDLREGVWPDRLVDTVKAAKELRNIKVAGLGCNLTCYGGIIPTVEHMNALIQAGDMCRRETGLELSILSGGNSSCLPLLLSGKLPAAINHFRIGESIVLGRNVFDKSPWPGTRQDTFIAYGEVLEVERKPSIPIGPRGRNAFGKVEVFVDRGVRRRAVCNLGRQDVMVDNIEPIDSRIFVLGASSDHLILDVEDACDSIRVGSQLEFFPGYGGLLALMTSRFVHKTVVKGR